MYQLPKKKRKCCKYACCVTEYYKIDENYLAITDNIGMYETYYREFGVSFHCQGILLLVDLSCIEKEELRLRIDNIMQIEFNYFHNKVIYVIGCLQQSKERIVTYEEMQIIAKEKNLNYFEIDLNSGFNIETVIETISAEVDA